MDETQAASAGLAATELSSNLVKHAKNGEVLARPFRDLNGSEGLELLAIDRGPGMADVQRCLQDGYSTASSAGHGLGAVARLSYKLDIYSRPGHGTAALCQILKTAPRHEPAPFLIGSVCVPVPGEEACGDAWAIRTQGAGLEVLLADGLGHGVLAAQAADVAVTSFLEQRHDRAAQIVERLHGPLRSTRGVSLAVAAISAMNDTLAYAGVGNIAGVILANGQTRSLVSNNGIVGHQMPRIHEFTYPYPRDATVVLHSDGLTTRWKLEAYPGVLEHHPSILAGILYRDFRRPRDDVAVVVIRR